MASTSLYMVPTAQEKQGKSPKEIPCWENAGNLEMLPKHRIFLIHHSKDQGYCAISHEISNEISQFILENYMCLPSEFCIRNILKSLKLAQGKFAVRQGKNRENTGILKWNLSGDPVYRCCVNYQRVLQVSVLITPVSMLLTFPVIKW